MENLTVVKSNHLIEAGYKLTLNEQRVLLACIAQIKPDSNIDKIQFEVSALELAELVGISSKKAYEVLEQAVNKLAERWVIIDIPDPKNPLERFKTRWVSGIGYAPQSGKIHLTFSYDILPYLSQLKQQFTQYKLSNVTNMTSTYAIRLYELLMQWQGTGKREVELEWLKQQFQIPNNYKSIKDFKKRVLEPAISQINQHSNLNVKWEQRKTGRKVTHLIFIFGLKNSEKKMTLSEYANSKENRTRTMGKSDQELIKMMKKDGIKFCPD